MSGWHREHPELVGTDADPWMIHESYRKALPRIVTGDELGDLEWEREQELEAEARRLREIDRPAEEDPIEDDRDWWEK